MIHGFTENDADCSAWLGSYLESIMQLFKRAESNDEVRVDRCVEIERLRLVELGSSAQKRPSSQEKSAASWAIMKLAQQPGN